jgi:peptidyl-prolyl cis-trans isomerase D
MPLMTKIRENLSTFFSIFAGVFVVYIVLDWGMDITGRKRAKSMAASQEIGKINGQAIQAKEFSEMVRRAVDNQKTQTGTEPDENQQQTIRDQIWNQLVDQALYDKEIERLGIKVTDQEIVDWVKGDNPPDFLRQQFTDSTGAFNRQAYETTIMNPQNKSIMVRVEDALRKQRLREKLQSIVTASVQVGEGDILQKFCDQNIKYEANYAFFDPSTLIKDDEVTASDDDLRRYFNDHSDEYKVEASRKLKYVLFPFVPSKDDSLNILTDIEDIMQRAKAGVEFDTLAKMYSETPINNTYRSHGSLSTEKENAIFSGKSGDIIGPIKESDGYHLVKVKDFRSGKDEFIHASHILIQAENNDTVKALKEAKNIFAMAKSGQDFTTLAKKYSKDPGSGAKGGDLGWLGKGRMVKPFEDAASKAKPGQVIGPIRTQFGYHIIKVHAKDNREVRFSDIRLPLQASARTRSDVGQRAQDFAYLAKQSSFDKEAAQSNYSVVETPSFQKDAVISGIGMNNAINKFAFKNKIGTLSEPFSLSNGSVVVMVTEVKDAGIRPFDEVKIAIQNRWKHEKKIDKVKALAQEMRKTLLPTDSLKILSTKNPMISVQHLAPFTFGGYIPGIGRDLNFMGGIQILKPGDISNPIESNRGIYIVQMLSKSTFDSTAYTSQRAELRNQLINEKKNRFFTEWADQLKKSADIVDNRDLFYR